MKHIVVIGGGIAGLAAAHRLVEVSRARSLEIKITLLEAAPRLGGSIATEHIGDFLVEGGPDSFITEKPWAMPTVRAHPLNPSAGLNPIGLSKNFRRTRRQADRAPGRFFLTRTNAAVAIYPFTAVLLARQTAHRRANYFCRAANRAATKASARSCAGALAPKRWNESLSRWWAAFMRPIPTS
jgi:monoamine oxidase